MFGITDLATYVLGVVIVVLLPGPNSLFVLSVAGRYGIRAGYRAACGVFLGDLVLMVLAAVGMASLLAAYPGLFSALKYVGAAYLAWLGAGLIVHAWRELGAGAPRAVVATQPAAHPFLRAFLISLSNPKAILFFMSFFIQFVDRSYPHPALSFAILGTIAQCASALYLSALILGGHRLAAGFRARPRIAAGASGGVGALFLTFSARLATATAG